MKNRAFTLIELLVVVLIIGILAAIALPQYSKAVQRARLAEFAMVVKTAEQAMDAYLLANGGFPSDVVYFTGKNDSGRLDITLPGTRSTTTAKNYLKIGGYDVGCTSLFCGISLVTSYNADGSTGNNWLNGETITVARLHGQDPTWYLIRVPVDEKTRKTVCQWWTGPIKDDTEEHASLNAKTACAAVGVN